MTMRRCSCNIASDLLPKISLILLRHPLSSPWKRGDFAGARLKVQAKAAMFIQEIKCPIPTNLLLVLERALQLLAFESTKTAYNLHCNLLRVKVGLENWDAQRT